MVLLEQNEAFLSRANHDTVQAAVFSPDGLRVLTASRDNTAKLWDAASGRELTAFHRNDMVYSAVFNPMARMS